MLLRASSDANNQTVDLHAVNGDGPAGLEFGAQLLAFAEAANRLDDTLPEHREAVRACLGEGGLMDAAATVAIFRGLNLTADAAGLPLDESFVGFAMPLIQELKIDRFPAAANTPGYGSAR